MKEYTPELYIANLIGLPLSYIQRIADTELYGFGFGEIQEYPSRCTPGRINRKTDYALHTLCPLALIWRTPVRKEEYFDPDTSLREFEASFRPLIGKNVIRARIAQHNNLRIDFGIAWLTTLSDVDDKDCETWRVFQPDSGNLHLVATSMSLKFL